jgi:hypothetical protein
MINIYIYKSKMALTLTKKLNGPETAMEKPTNKMRNFVDDDKRNNSLVSK